MFYFVGNKTYSRYLRHLLRCWMLFIFSCATLLDVSRRETLYSTVRMFAPVVRPRTMLSRCIHVITTAATTMTTTTTNSRCCRRKRPSSSHQRPFQTAPRSAHLWAPVGAKEVGGSGQHVCLWCVDLTWGKLNILLPGTGTCYVTGGFARISTRKRPSAF